MHDTVTNQLKLLGWEATGLRCPDHVIDFSRGKNGVYPISLVQMPNGTGKTTALHLLRAALSGAAAEWTPAQVRELRKKDGGNDVGCFTLRLMHDDRRITIAITLDFDDGKARYGTTVASGLKQGFHPPQQLKPFLRPEFVKLFVFDGELAQQLLSPKHTNAQSAVDELFRLDLLAAISDRVSDYWERQTEGQTAKAQQGLTKWKRRVGSLERRITQLRKDQKKLEMARAEVYEEHESLRSEIEDGLRARADAQRLLDAADESVIKTCDLVTSLSVALFNGLTQPAQLSEVFAEGLELLKSGLDRAKLPESAAREFFEELANDEEVCVCGRDLDEECRSRIREHAKSYMGSEEVAFLNAMKSDISRATAARSSGSVTTIVGDLEDSIAKRGEAQTERDRVKRHALGEDPELEKAERQRSELQRQLDALDGQLASFEDTDTSRGVDTTTGIPVLIAQLEEAKRTLDKVVGTVTLRAKRDAIMSLLERAEERGRKTLCANIVRRANSRIVKLMPNNDIRISRIESRLVLKGQEEGSVGETLSVAYAFLSTLFGQAEYQLPFIVDSPAGPIDFAIRPEIAKLIPQLSNQFIAFTISSEREKFVQPLADGCDGELQYLTLFRKGNRSVDDAGRRCSHTETEDGLLVSGAKFFEQFQLENEA